eukprot:scpid80903/ scgid13946/ 
MSFLVEMSLADADQELGISACCQVLSARQAILNDFMQDTAQVLPAMEPRYLNSGMHSISINAGHKGAQSSAETWEPATRNLVFVGLTVHPYSAVTLSKVTKSDASCCIVTKRNESSANWD